MSAALEKSTEEFNKLKSCVVDISAKRVDCDIKDVPDRKNGDRHDNAKHGYAVERQYIDDNFADFVDDHSDDRR